MILKNWEDLPPLMKNDKVKEYYDILHRKKISLIVKRIFDLVVATMMSVVLFPVFIIIGIAIKIDSKGPIFFRQVRVTQYGRSFKIFKFRTMIEHGDQVGPELTSKDDFRITKVGRLLRRFRLDEVPQLLNIIIGDMTFVGTRPEVVKYVKHYTDEMLATLLIPAGVTSCASIRFKDEEGLLNGRDDIDTIYIGEILSKKMKYNLEGIRNFSLLNDIKLMVRTIIAVFLYR